MGADGQPLQTDLASGTAPLELIDASIELDGRPVAVQTAYMQLKANAMRMEIAQYAADCGVPADTIVALADKFTSHGRRAAITGHGGMMSGSGFYNAFGVVALNLLIGNVNWKGGLAINGGTFRHDGDGPRYRLASFEGQIKPGASRSGATCLTRRPASSHSRKPPANPSPAQAPWFPNAPGLTTQWLTGAMEGYPYRLKALIMWSVNPMYGIPGLRAQLGEDFADPRKLPLIVSVDPLINESNAYADYIVPDSMLYESWGWTAPWNGVPTRMTTARWPVIEPRMDKTADGQRIGIEAFLIAVSKSIGLPGFGANAIADAEGKLHALDCAEDWFCAAAPTLPTREGAGTRRKRRGHRGFRRQPHPRAARKHAVAGRMAQGRFPSTPRRSLSSTCTGAGCGTSGMDELALQGCPAHLQRQRWWRQEQPHRQALQW